MDNDKDGTGRRDGDWAAASDLPLRAPDAPRRSWAAFAVVGAAIAAFASGAFLYATYPSWITRNDRSQATVSRSDASQGIRDVRPNEREVERTAPAAHPSDGATPAPGDTEPPTLSGEWSLNTRVVSSSLQRYEGLRLGYRVRLQQVGNYVTGTGYKLRENDRAVATKTPIAISGDVDGDRVVLTFQEQGTRRASIGKLVLHRESEDVLRGRFSSDAAQSTGVVDARR